MKPKPNKEHLMISSEFDVDGLWYRAYLASSLSFVQTARGKSRTTTWTTDIKHNKFWLPRLERNGCTDLCVVFFRAFSFIRLNSFSETGDLSRFASALGSCTACHCCTMPNQNPKSNWKKEKLALKNRFCPCIYRLQFLCALQQWTLCVHTVKVDTHSWGDVAAAAIAEQLALHSPIWSSCLSKRKNNTLLKFA